MGERIDLTIDSGCAACALLMGIASPVGMQELSRTPQEYSAANAVKIRELGFKSPTLKFQNGDVQNLKFGVMDKLHKPMVASQQAIGSCCSLKTMVVLSSKMCARSAGNESLDEMEFSCSRVGSSKEVRRNGWRLWTSRAQTTGRSTRKPSHQCRGKWSRAT